MNEGATIRFRSDFGPDAPTVTRPNGARESACPFAIDVIPVAWPMIRGAYWYLRDPDRGWAVYPDGMIENALRAGTRREALALLTDAAGLIARRVSADRLVLAREVGRVLAEGEAKYGHMNWVGIPWRGHVRHANAHLFAHESGDRSEGEVGHLTHAIVRLAFAIENLERP